MEFMSVTLLVSQLLMSKLVAMIPLNMPLMSVTLLVFRLPRLLMVASDEQPLNMASMFVTLAVLKLPRSMLDNCLQPRNIPLMSVTLLVFQLLPYENPVILLQPLNKSAILVTLEVL